jgi:hypothetical protein
VSFFFLFCNYSILNFYTLKKNSKILKKRKKKEKKEEEGMKGIDYERCFFYFLECRALRRWLQSGLILALCFFFLGLNSGSELTKVKYSDPDPTLTPLSLCVHIFFAKASKVNLYFTPFEVRFTSLPSYIYPSLSRTFIIRGEWGTLNISTTKEEAGERRRRRVWTFDPEEPEQPVQTGSKFTCSQGSNPSKKSKLFTTSQEMAILSIPITWKSPIWPINLSA